MAEDTKGARLTYVPNKTLGRSGYTPSPRDRLSERIRQLDALAAVVSDIDSEGASPLLALNEQIVCGVLDLVADLAHEIHELHEQLLLEDMARRAETQAT